MSGLGLNKTFKAVKNSYIPAVFFASAVFIYCCIPHWTYNDLSLLNIVFYVLCVVNILFLSVVNRAKPLFALLWAVGAYIGINRIKAHIGDDFLFDASFILISILLPLNWLFFTLLPQRALKNTRNFYYLCAVLIQGMCIEKAPLIFSGIFSFFGPYEILTLWFLISLFLLIALSRQSSITETGMFFALLCILTGLSNVSSDVSLTIYFIAAVFILFAVSVQEFVYTYFRDALTSVYSQNSYYRHSRKSFPLKYTIGVICIDDYGKLLKVFGEKKLNLLTKMAIVKIQSAETGAEIYRYAEDEFILVFKNQDLKQSYEALENIRRSIAGSEFVLSAGKIVKITISAGVSEKKRSDANADVVLARTREVLQKAYKFTQNMTSKA